MKKIIPITFFMLLVLIVGAKDMKILSPDKKIQLTISTGSANRPGLNYSVMFKGRVVLAASPMGFEFEHEIPLSNHLEVVSVNEKLNNTMWKPVYGERSSYPDFYRAVTIQLKETTKPFRSFSIDCRVYNEGLAFRYNINTNKPLTITRELTGFQFTDDHPSWIAQHSQASYVEGKVSKTMNELERPYVIKTQPDCFVALGEAALTDYTQMRFSRSAIDSLLLLAALKGKVLFDHSFSTPWRYVMIAESEAKLLENNYLVLNLNKPNALKDVPWIKPGKVIREVTLTTTGGKACIDFAAKHKLSYVEFDAGWYGHEYDNAASALAVNVDTSRSPGPLNLHEIIDYGKQKGVGIILYVNQRALSKQLDTILPLYKSWGVKGIKYGFVNVSSQAHITWLHEAIRKAAAHQLMLDIHDDYRPTGYSRTYPNLITQEGVRGDEESPDNRQALITIFTRMLAGAADATNCYFAPRVNQMGSHASQMAKAICIYSPWQFVYWYDRPVGSPLGKGGAGTNTSAAKTAVPVIEEIPDLGFYDALPTVWDDTRVLEGKIGAYATIARRNGDNWYVGSLTDQARKFSLAFSFLKKNVKYEATLYADDDSLQTDTKIYIRRIKVDSATVLDLDLKNKNGVAIIIKALNR
ncbi:glycoside hydrolase family 97 protein [Pedobacter sp. HDW13]|uniref:glycoside hydrolase family 97 protein n=1 Tax=unclassified Pedobacter TaxID=2628915 RepID=UPI000F59BDEA|nr:MULTISPECIES: glycoside hydrolase family 97 protein [unclassified Pedobacter]QIL41347.1 glycoside hydrolase family 97 protein [Pedobacter sp. HDW13]RQO78121.1 alpha-glucosidase [Pedobacter sp. KBW01]